MLDSNLSKTHVAQQIVRSLGSIPSVVILSQVSYFSVHTRLRVSTKTSQDSFYKEHTPEELELAFANQYDFDHPDAIDMPMFAAVRHKLQVVNGVCLNHAPSVSQT